MSEKSKNSRQIEYIFKFINWVIFVGLMVISAIYIKNVLEYYQRGETSIKVTNEVRKDLYHPTITVCFQPIAKYSRLKSYKNSETYYEYTLFDFVYNTIPLNLNKSWPEFYKEMSYRIGQDFFVYLELHDNQKRSMIHLDIHDKNSTDLIEFEEVYTLHSGLCFMITPNFRTKEGKISSLIIRFHDHINNFGEVPLVEVYFTSKDNAHGILASEWLLGDMYSLVIRPDDLLKQRIGLNPSEFERIESKCSEESYKECISKR